jgi:hypothetical protein
MGVSDEAKNVIPLKFLRKFKNKNFFPLVNSIRGHTVYNLKCHFHIEMCKCDNGLKVSDINLNKNVITIYYVTKKGKHPVLIVLFQ